MDIKWFIGAGILIGIACAGISVYQMNMNMTLLSIIGVFTLTNAMRAQTFKDRDMIREARWMNSISFLFLILFCIVLVVTVIL